jgi:hypothetical protein
LKATELYKLMFSPPWTGKLLHLFLSGALSIDSTGIKFELIYYALPFILDDAIASKLSRSNATSTFDSTFDKAEHRNCLLDKASKISNYSEITGNGLIYLSSYTNLKLSSKISVSPIIHYNSEKDIYLRPKYRTAYNWGIILGKEDHLNIILKIGAYSL